MELTGRSQGRKGRAARTRPAVSLARWLTPDPNAGAERERDGRLSGALCGVTALNNLIVLTQVHQHVGTQIVMDASIAVLAPALALIPWRRLPDGALYFPVVVGIAILTLGYGALLGELEHFGPLYTLAFGYTGLVLAPGQTLRVALVALAGLGVAVGFGNQHEHVVELVGTIAISCLIGELVAAAVAIQRRHRGDLERLHAGLAGLITADGQLEAAESIANLAADLLAADGVTVMTRDGAGSSTMIARGGYGLGANVNRAHVDIDAEQSGMGIVVRNGEPLFIADAPGSNLVLKRYIGPRSATSILWLPVLGRQEVMGVLVVWWSTPITGLDAFAEQVVRLLSIQAGPVLERVRQLEDLDRAATTDPLTGIGNRRAFEACLHEPADDAALIVCDLDRFKLLNDSLGHPAGDRVLKAFAQAAIASVRSGDLVARIGGDEFALLVQGGQAGADAVLMRLGMNWTQPEGVGFSAGTAARHPGEDGQQLSERADQDLYAAKRRSQNAPLGGRDGAHSPMITPAPPPEHAQPPL